MKKLKFPIEKNKFRYELIERKKRYALVKQINLAYPDAPIKYELWLIKTITPPKSWNIEGKIEVMPTTTRWGQEGWTYFQLADAMHDYQEKIANLSS